MSESDKLRTVDDLAREFVSCVRDGFDGTDVKAGLICEIGCSWPWTDAERRSVTAAAIAQQETGALVSIHPGRAPEAPFAIAEALQAAGADLQRTIMCHVERRLYDSESILRLAETGMVLEFDLFGLESSYFAQGRDVPLSSDGARLDWIEALLQAGYRDQIVISHDICQKTRLVEFGGHGYGHIFRNIVPMMHGIGSGRSRERGGGDRRGGDSRSARVPEL
jgi:phosphotriesterase-related protein